MSVLERAIMHFDSRPVHQIDIPEWGCTVYFKTPNMATLRKVSDESKGSGHEMTARLVAHCALDADGKRMFQALDYKDLMIKADPGVVGRIGNAIQDTIRIELDVDAQEKNSAATQPE